MLTPSPEPGRQLDLHPGQQGEAGSRARLQLVAVGRSVPQEPACEELLLMPPPIPV